ncbi:hypothetical protein BELL_0452g00030 [Botrytis elliptica]|uniref:Uncharacterized protein n=1 Tax=Botrytis elliptica TaxID=278938 RepID=A0A4Z1JU93_9HELO|nr:hypothetical protein BELL_0452g00030 [Botrytis elliptica]
MMINNKLIINKVEEYVQRVLELRKIGTVSQKKDSFTIGAGQMTSIHGTSIGSEQRGAEKSPNQVTKSGASATANCQNL